MSVNSADLHSQNGSTDTWQMFKTTGNVDDRNRLIEAYLPIVRYQAERVHSTMPEEVELDDLKSAGVFGLMSAIDAFDLSRDVKFETYCVPRIRGAIIDELRKMDHAPRLVRARNKRVQEVRRALRDALHHEPTDEETADALASAGDKPAIMQDGAFVRGKSSLQRKVYETDSLKDVIAADEIGDARAPSPSAREEQVDFYREMYKGLDPRERLLMIMYYREKLPMKQVGIQLGVSESRISQMHSDIIARIRERYAGKDATEKREDIDPQAEGRENFYWKTMFGKLTDAILESKQPMPTSTQSDPDLQDTAEVHPARSPSRPCSGTSPE